MERVPDKKGEKRKRIDDEAGATRKRMRAVALIALPSHLVLPHAMRLAARRSPHLPVVPAVFKDELITVASSPRPTSSSVFPRCAGMAGLG